MYVTMNVTDVPTILKAINSYPKIRVHAYFLTLSLSQGQNIPNCSVDADVVLECCEYIQLDVLWAVMNE